MSYLLFGVLLLLDPSGGRGGTYSLSPPLDKALGAAAVEAYPSSRSRFCPGAAAEKVGISCDPTPDANPLASGSFLRPGASEVLLDVPSGQDLATGERTLVIMEKTASGYRLERPLSGGNGFEVHARVTAPGRPDRLFLCELSGHHGLYPAVCGLLGQGYFVARPKDGGGNAADDRIDLPNGFVTVCGPAAQITLGNITVQNDHLMVELVADEYVLKKGGPDEDEVLCSRRTHKSQRLFVIIYQLGPKGARRLTPIPKHVRDIVDRFDL